MPLRFLTLVVLTLVMHVSFAATQAAETKQKPNVVFLFADDQRADTIGALGNSHIKTPNLDQLVRSGFVFRNAYCLGANVPAVCTPSRNMLLSGRAFFRWQGPQAQPDMPNFPTSIDRKSTRLNSSHITISYAVFC